MEKLPLGRCQGKFAAFVLLLTVVIVAPGFAQNTNKIGSAKIGLNDAYKAALEKSEIPRIEDSHVEQAQERLRQSQGSVIPHLEFNWSYLRQDVPRSLDVQDPLTQRASGGFLRPDQVTTRFTLTQPLFQGFREFAGIEGLRANLESARQLREAQKLALFQSVARAYFDVVSAEKDLADIQDLIQISENQNRVLQSFTRLGRSRRSDFLTSQAQLANLRAQVVNAESVRQQSREQFAYVTGLGAETELQDPQTSLPESLPSIETYLKSLDDRPDLKSLRAAADAAEQQVRYQRGGHWPKLDLTGNYYLARTGYLEGSKWDVGLNLNFPIYEGGVTQSRVREAQAASTEARLRFEQARRQAVEEVSAYYKVAVSGIRQMGMIRNSLTLVQQAYQEQVRDFQRGANTNLDVLSALNSLEDARRTLDRTYYQLQMNLISLQTAQGKIPSVF